MEINVLYFGDIVGKPGRKALAEVLPGLKERFDADLVLANSENATHGDGFSRKHYDELTKIGIDGFTGGDHIFGEKDFMQEIENPDVRVARPANYYQASGYQTPGRGYFDIIVKGKKVRVVNLLGRVFMNGNFDNPFHTFDRLYKELPSADAWIVDLHAEATSEKRNFAEYVSSRVQLVVGTHTHVPTADAQIINGQTAFISDLGMVGPTKSSLGADISETLKNFLTGLPWTYSVSAGQCELGAVFCRINLDQKCATHIEHIRSFTKD